MVILALRKLDELLVLLTGMLGICTMEAVIQSKRKCHFKINISRGQMIMAFTVFLIIS